jgi:hypothetical protein
MTQEEAKKIIEAALDKATQKGVYSLQDMNYIIQALDIINSLDKIEIIKNN